MSSLKIKKTDSFELECNTIASDKSISHRCAIFSLLSDRVSIIKNYLLAEDTLNTLEIVKKLGATVETRDDTLIITPPKKIKEPDDILDCGNSGTAIRLYCGLLASQDGFFVLHGDKYLAKRPMKRVTDPLKSIGAKIDGADDGNLCPLAIRGRKLKSFDYESSIASAQVKSALILAALNSEGISSFKEPLLSRDHTERILNGMGAVIKREKNSLLIHPLTKPLEPLNIKVPADPSSGFFFAIAAAIKPGSKVVLKEVSLNPTRIEAYKVLQKMGAIVEFLPKEDLYEPIGDIVVKYNKLRAVTVEENIAWLIDELPALAVAMAYANGVSVVKNAKELRVKESDRIKSVVENLKRCGISAEEKEDGFEIRGGVMKEAKIDSFGDHRIAMSFAIAGLGCGMQIEDTACIKTSFPNFVEILNTICEVESGD
jgi:3-phosphoshikimate 1-carboxyvinyltransferase